MDRRQALRSIAVGGSVTVAASAIVSSPAFAYDAPAPLTNGSAVVGTSNADRFDFDQTSLGSASCPMSADNTTAGTQLVRWDITTTSMTPTNSVIQIRRNNGGPVEDITSLGNPGVSTQVAGFRPRKRNAAQNGNRNWNNGDRFQVDQVVRFTCTYSDGTTRTTTQTTTFTITRTGGSWVVT